MADLPSDKGFNNLRDCKIPKKYLKSATGIPVGKRVKMPRFIEKRAMEGADTNSDIHGGRSHAAHRLTIFMESDINDKKNCAKCLAGRVKAISRLGYEEG
jgi:4-hydroxybutyryl-CoA dehydratase/vinylacetyl-CoA-Delta-isomerase